MTHLKKEALRPDSFVTAAIYLNLMSCACSQVRWLSQMLGRSDPDRHHRQAHGRLANSARHDDAAQSCGLANSKGEVLA
jgi:hypothetical protein